jgi:hypothetical protein
MDWTATMLAATDVASDPAYQFDGLDLCPALADASHAFARSMH